MGKASSKVYRERMQHDLWKKVFRRMLPKMSVVQVAKAIAELEQKAAAEGLVLNNNTTAVVRNKQKVRGGQTADFFEKDKDAVEIEIFAVLSGALQKFLNACFVAEKM